MSPGDDDMIDIPGVRAQEYSDLGVLFTPNLKFGTPYIHHYYIFKCWDDLGCSSLNLFSIVLIEMGTRPHRHNLSLDELNRWCRGSGHNVGTSRCSKVPKS